MVHNKRDLKVDIPIVIGQLKSMSDSHVAIELNGKDFLVKDVDCLQGIKADVVVNGKFIRIRSLDHTDLPLINHSHRLKFKKVCDRLDISMSEFDSMVDEYWRKRTLEIIHEDVTNSSEFSPFAEHKQYLKPILTSIVFDGINCTPNDHIDYVLDYSDPSDTQTWHLYSREDYIDKIWPYLRFSFRADRGMPANYDPKSEAFKEIHPWVHYWNNQYKGALHIRIVSYDSGRAKPMKFVAQYMEEIKEVSANQGERDEIVVKIFFVEARMRGIPLPVGDKVEQVTSVGMYGQEYKDTPISGDWNMLSTVEILAISKICGIDKSKSGAKADVYVNHKGISIKSNHGAAPTIINQTKRSSILRIMTDIKHPIVHLDEMVDRYWNLRLDEKVFGEDIRNASSNSPFLGFNGIDGKTYLKPLLNYFAFKGSGKSDSEFPAEYILEVDDPCDITSWTFYDAENYVDSVWKRLVFSIRGKGLPQTLDDEDLRWVREVEGKKKGTLNVRVAK
jgi:hypothetical protein